MQLTAYSDYALRVLMYLACVAQEDERLASIDEIARAYGISRNHVMKVVHHLATTGFVETVRGRGGGTRLAVAASAIRIGAVYRATESFALAPCNLTGAHRCTIASACLLREALDEALARLFDVLDAWTLADLVSKGAPLAPLLQIGPAPRRATSRPLPESSSSRAKPANRSRRANRAN